ncbi:MAG TPA: hypothetical protein VF834_23050 [Streptosporangiaceae bacterium]
MDTDRRRLPDYEPAEPAGPGGPDVLAGARQSRSDGIRRVRRMSNWTAAALLAGTGAAAVALATHSFPASTTAATSSSTNAAGTQTASAPHVGGAVTTSGGSGATVTTTTHVVNGRTVVTRVVHPAVYHDN